MVRVIIEREYDGCRRVKDENDIKIGDVWKHAHPAQDGLPAEVEWQYCEGLVGIFSAPTLRELRRMIEARTTTAQTGAGEGE